MADLRDTLKKSVEAHSKVLGIQTKEGTNANAGNVDDANKRGGGTNGQRDKK